MCAGPVKTATVYHELSCVTELDHRVYFIRFRTNRRPILIGVRAPSRPLSLTSVRRPFSTRPGRLCPFRSHTDRRTNIACASPAASFATNYCARPNRTTPPAARASSSCRVSGPRCGRCRWRRIVGHSHHCGSSPADSGQAQYRRTRLLNK